MENIKIKQFLSDNITLIDEFLCTCYEFGTESRKYTITHNIDNNIYDVKLNHNGTIKSIQIDSNLDIFASLLSVKEDNQLESILKRHFNICQLLN
jgi:hypothetical protein